MINCPACLLHRSDSNYGRCTVRQVAFYTGNGSLIISLNKLLSPRNCLINNYSMIGRNVPPRISDHVRPHCRYLTTCWYLTNDLCGRSSVSCQNLVNALSMYTLHKGMFDRVTARMPCGDIHQTTRRAESFEG